MKKILTLALLAISIGASSQKMYTMQSPPIYDQDGTVYQVRQVLDHLPTHNDTLEFDKSIKKYCIEINRANNQKRGVRQYQTIVAEVRISKKGHVAIKPTTRFKSPWYRYYDETVKVGDTIWISREDAIEPRF
jgi:nickel-dependent lactate racemase